MNLNELISKESIYINWYHFMQFFCLFKCDILYRDLFRIFFGKKLSTGKNGLKTG